MKGLALGQRPRTFFLILIGIIVLLPSVLQAQSSCQTGNSSISSPGNNNVIPTTYTVVAQATTGGSCDITDLRLYVDNVSVYNVKVAAPSAGFSKPITFTQGYHRLVVVAWNNQGYAFASPATEIFAAATNQKVYITSPPTKW